MNPNLDTLVTSLYVTIDDLLVENRWWAPERPAVGIVPKLSDAELITLAVVQALLGYTSEARFLRYAHAHLKPWFPYLPTRTAYNKRLRRSSTMMSHVMGYLARSTRSWHDDLWLLDSTPIECGRSRQTQQRSDLAGWAEYGYSPAHSRYFWGLRLHLVATPSGLPITWAVAGAKADERRTALEMIAHARVAPPGPDSDSRQRLPQRRLRTSSQPGRDDPHPPGHQNRETPPGKPVPQTVPPNHRVGQQHFQTQLDLERHGGRTKPGVIARILQRLLALTAVIWHNETTHQPGPARSLTAYDH